ncbi:MAG: HEAT repeat domain-containing protein [Planctomycetes bacterium]|nr:HEAT repeat domain-containing protein [Planctomycetota bacterium]
MDPGITDAFPTVAAALDDPDFKVRASAIVALMRSYRHGRNTQINRLAPKITVLLADPESDVRRAALFAVGTLKIEPETSISAIVASLRDSDAAIRSSAATELSRARFNWAMTETVEKKLADAIPAVASLLDDEALYVRSSAFRAILSMGETFTLPLPVTQQMYVALEKAIVAARVSALHASKKAISNGIASTHKDTLLNTVSSPVDAMFSLSSHAEIPAAVARAIYSMFERELENGNENKRFFAVRSIMRVSAKLKVPSSTIERLGGLFDNPSAAVRDIASKALLEVRHGDE